MNGFNRVQNFREVSSRSPASEHKLPDFGLINALAKRHLACIHSRGCIRVEWGKIYFDFPMFVSRYAASGYCPLRSGQCGGFPRRRIAGTHSGTGAFHRAELSWTRQECGVIPDPKGHPFTIFSAQVPQFCTSTATELKLSKGFTFYNVVENTYSNEWHETNGCVKVKERNETA